MGVTREFLVETIDSVTESILSFMASPLENAAA
jgi:hypothetical protein